MRIVGTVWHVVTFPAQMVGGTFRGAWDTLGHWHEELAALLFSPLDRAWDREYWRDDDYALARDLIDRTAPGRDLCLHCGLADCDGQCPIPIPAGATHADVQVKVVNLDGTDVSDQFDVLVSTEPPAPIPDTPRLQIAWDGARDAVWGGDR
jgi:hypothetical protein